MHSFFLLLGIKSLLLNIEYLFVFVKCYLQFFPHTLNQSTQKLPIIHIINQNHFFAPSYGDSISASSIIFTATGTGFTKSLSMRTNTLLRINILRHCIDFIYLIQTYFLPKQMSHQYYGFRLLLLH